MWFNLQTQLFKHLGACRRWGTLVVAAGFWLLPLDFGCCRSLDSGCCWLLVVVGLFLRLLRASALGRLMMQYAQSTFHLSDFHAHNIVVV